MQLSIQPDGPVPIYQQIRDQVVEAIATADLPAGAGLPSTRQLAVDLGINFHTVNKAYDLLRQEGLLRIGRKSGAVAARDAASGPPRPGWEQDWAGRLRTLLAEAAAQGLPADDIISRCQAVVAQFAFPAAPAAACEPPGAARHCPAREAGKTAGPPSAGQHSSSTRSSSSSCGPTSKRSFLPPWTNPTMTARG